MLWPLFASKKKKKKERKEKKIPSLRTSISFLFLNQNWEEDLFFGVQTPQDGFKLSEGTSLDS